MYCTYIWRTARAHVRDTCGGFGETDGGRTGQIRVCEKKPTVPIVACGNFRTIAFPRRRVSTRVLPLTGARKV